MTSKNLDDTFRIYSSSKATDYAAHRSAYPDYLIQKVIDHHKTTGGSSTTLLDVGCGPGTATRALAPHFDRSIGIDPSSSMLDTARNSSPPISSATGEPTTFIQCGAESLSSLLTYSDIQPPLTPGSIDLITAGTAAHWFPLEAFYTGCAELLKPGGTIALWCIGGTYVHPLRTPRAKEIQAIIDELESVTLKPHEIEGNRISNTLYLELARPWSFASYEASDQTNGIASLDRETFVHWGFNRRGALSSPPTSPSPSPSSTPTNPEPSESKPYSLSNPYPTSSREFLMSSLRPLSELAANLGTTSMVQRWRAEHKSRVESGEEEDCVDKAMGDIARALDQAEREGDEL